MREHYIELSGRSFFPGLISYLASSPVVCMVWSGVNAVKLGRTLIGETNVGSIRGDFCVQTGIDVIHGSDTVECAEREIALWFRPNELYTIKPY
jgi:nucleoside-diphosphate kinase